MASVNKVILLGNLGRDPEMRYTADGAAITNITLATSRRYKDSSGQQQEETDECARHDSTLSDGSSS